MVWASGESAGVAVCLWPENVLEVLYPRLCCVGRPRGPREQPSGAFTCPLGLLSTPRCPGRLPRKLCLLAWHARSLPTAGPRRR